ncbi:quinone oxidoreductase [Dyadobacter sp. CY261]|uniref:quinone oxidoreductase family protein n=1 Tax=Dyadobacter sp. CY261 TaxID=2907203 RepID=UPI001F3865AC|nr:quinone oxidoreductase [Dyadobacter sp. CY261]MCF0069371.1 quinone oxidoreductase [Dyadobacter sp. CY261]
MKATNESGVVRLTRQGPPSALEYVTEQVGMPKDHEVLIRHEAIALNFVDVLFRNGNFPLRQFPATIGVEAAGVVEAVGTGVKDWIAGDRIAYYFSLGAYAERRLIDPQQLVKLPDDITFDQAASLLAKGLTARMLVKQAYPVQIGDVVLVHAAAGGVGSLVSRWAKSLGATVIGTVGNAAKKALVQQHGLDLVVALDTEDLAQQVNSITNGQGVDVAYDGVGKATFGKSVDLLKSGGTIVLFGNASGEPEIDSAYLHSKQIKLIKPAIGQYLPDRKSVDVATAELFEAFRTGVLGTVEPAVYPLSQVAKAHQDLEASRTTGSVILHPLKSI